MSTSEIASDALRYWEPRRIGYNLAMLIVVAAFYLGSIEKGGIWVPSLLGFISVFGAAVAANVLYSIVYPIEAFVQRSDLRQVWLGIRWVMYSIGTLLAVGLTYYCMVILHVTSTGFNL
ncbi:MAG: hypothetical protein AAGJ79_05740 [Verrucomicrobiota bacterium]